MLAEINELHLIALPAIGLAAGVLGGLLGIGGGLVMIPAMLFALGEPFGVGTLHVYKLAALMVGAMLSIPAVIRHSRAGAIDRAALPSIVIGGIAGVLIGVGVASVFSGAATAILKRVFGGFLIATVVFNAIERRLRKSTPDDANAPSSVGATRRLQRGAVVGFPAGVVSGLLGVGGGVWSTPAQHLFLRTPLRNAIANSAGMIVGLAPAAAICQAFAVARMSDLRVADAFPLAAMLAPTAIFGAWIGARLTHVLPLNTLRYCFWALLLVGGARLIWAS